MLPRFVENNFTDRSLCDLVLLRNLALDDALGVQRANLSNLVCGEFCTGVENPLCTAMSLSTFSVHVGKVFGGGAKKQVGRVDASANVASVADAQAIGYGAVVKFPRYAMGVYHCLGSLCSDSSITICTQEALPQPAFVGGTGRYVLPKAFTEWFVGGHKKSPVGIDRQLVEGARIPTGGN